MRQTRSEGWLAIVADFEKGRRSKEYRLDDVVQFAIDTKRWTLERERAANIARAELRAALKGQADEDGDRLYLNAKTEQGELWAHRRRASHPLRQNYLLEQCTRVVQHRDSVLRMLEKLNHERKPGEPEFQIRFDWDGKKGAG